jgi:Glycoside hydrolase family 44
MALRSTILGCIMAGLALGQNPAITIAVDAGANRRAISPNIYGMAWADPTALADLNCPVNRMGGNSTSRYNWQINADNRGADWFFESIGDASAAAGERGDTFFSNAKAAGAQAMLTIPMIGWVAKLGANRAKLASFSQAKYGTQTGNDWQWFADAGNGALKSTGQNVSGNDPNDAGIPVDSVYQQNWVRALTSKWGAAADGGVRYYILDNEPSLWHSTHRDVHPTGASMDEVRDKILDYAAKIKAVDPSATIVGPEEWGWSGYLLSGYDQQYGSVHGWSYLPDRAAHGNADYLPWLLDQLHASAVASSQRPLDVFSVHYYPQGGEFGDDVSTLTQVLRNHSTRSLWDPNYVDESWINDKVDLIPRLRNWVSTHYFSDGKSRSRNTTGERKRTSTAPPRRQTSWEFSDAKAWISPRAGPRLILPRPPTKPSRCIATITGRNPHSETPACWPARPIPTTWRRSRPSAPPMARSPSWLSASIWRGTRR